MKTPAAIPQKGFRDLKEPVFGRVAAARFLAISVAELKRREQLELYGRGGIDAKGRRRYSQEDLDVMRRQGKSRAELRSPLGRENPFSPTHSKLYTTELAVRVFEELDQGTALTKIVTKLVIHPHQVEAIYAAWVNLGQGIHLRASIVRAINALALKAPEPITTDEELLQNLTRIASALAAVCAHCKRRPPQVCSRCAGWQE